MHHWTYYDFAYLFKGLSLPREGFRYWDGTPGLFQDLALLLGVFLPIWWFRAERRLQHNHDWRLRRATILLSLAFVTVILGVEIYIESWNFLVSCAELVDAHGGEYGSVGDLLGVNSPVPVLVGGLSALIPLGSALVLLRRAPRSTSATSAVMEPSR